MKLGEDQRRAAIALCCEVARADGEVRPVELEALLDLLVRLGSGVVAYAELQRWLDEGPPEIAAELSEDEMRACIRDALTIAQSDGTIADEEVATIKSYMERRLRKPATA